MEVVFALCRVRKLVWEMHVKFHVKLFSNSENYKHSFIYKFCFSNYPVWRPNHSRLVERNQEKYRLKLCRIDFNSLSLLFSPILWQAGS